mgnify:CR=1 FL=1
MSGISRLKRRKWRVRCYPMLPQKGRSVYLQRSYQLFFFGMQIGELEGPLLYELISKACSCGRGPKQLAPGVVFVREKDDAKLPKELERDVRVKDVISKPIRIDRRLKTVKSIVEVKDPTAG